MEEMRGESAEGETLGESEAIGVDHLGQKLGRIGAETKKKTKTLNRCQRRLNPRRERKGRYSGEIEKKKIGTRSFSAVINVEASRQKNIKW